MCDALFVKKPAKVISLFYMCKILRVLIYRYKVFFFKWIIFGKMIYICQSLKPLTMNQQTSLSTYLETLIRESLSLLQTQFASEMLTDLYWQVNLSSGEFVVLNDNQQVLVRASVKEWVSDDVEKSLSIKEIEQILRDIVQKLESENFLENINVQMPFSILMVDEDMENLCELFFVDEESVPLDNNIIRHIDEELDAFFKELMAD